VAYWHYRGGDLGPALPGKERRVPLTYLQLVEVAFVATFRRLGVSLQRLREARAYLAQVFNSEHPFADYRLQTEGHHVLMDLQEIEPNREMGRLIVTDGAGQMAWQELVADRFLQFEYERGGVAITWHPRGWDSPVVIDPRVCFGAPMVRGVPTWVLRGRYTAGEAIDEIAEDFTLKSDEIVQALSFEGIKDAA
jgi:uncharacterized protein (DUF433 family)